SYVRGGRGRAPYAVAQAVGRAVHHRGPRRWGLGVLSVVLAGVLGYVQPDPPVRALYLAIVGGGGPLNLVLLRLMMGFDNFDKPVATGGAGRKLLGTLFLAFAGFLLLGGFHGYSSNLPAMFAFIAVAFGLGYSGYRL